MTIQAWRRFALACGLALSPMAVDTAFADGGRQSPKVQAAKKERSIQKRQKRVRQSRFNLGRKKDRDQYILKRGKKSLYSSAFGSY